MSDVPAKRPKERVAYRPRPLMFADGRNEMCRVCVHFEPAEAKDDHATCAVVEGEVSPAGWCVRFKRAEKDNDPWWEDA